MNWSTPPDEYPCRRISLGLVRFGVVTFPVSHPVFHHFPANDFRLFADVQTIQRRTCGRWDRSLPDIEFFAGSDFVARWPRVR